MLCTVDVPAAKLAKREFQDVGEYLSAFFDSYREGHGGY